MEKLTQHTSVAIKIYKALKIEKGEFTHFSGLGISPPYRNKEYGTKLVAEAKEKGYKGAYVETTGEYSYTVRESSLRF